MTTNKAIYRNIEGLRAVFSIIIVIYHIFNYVIFNYVDNDSVYSSLSKYTERAYIIVDFFFIISGFFLAVAIKKGKRGIGVYAMNKVARLGPVLWLAMLLSAVVFLTINWQTAFMNSCFLQCIGLSSYLHGHTWYLSPYFWAIITLFAALTLFDRKKVNFVLAIVVYLSYTYAINWNKGFLIGREVVENFVSLGLLRAFGGIGLGYLLHLALDWLIMRLPLKWDARGRLDCRLPVRLILTLLELFFAARIFKCLCFSHKAFPHDFIYILFFSAFLALMVVRGGCLSRLLDNRFSEIAGKYSYSIYIMQQICFNILGLTLWSNKEYISANPIGTVALSVAFCIVVGIAVYYLVEKPALRLFRKTPLLKPKAD